MRKPKIQLDQRLKASQFSRSQLSAFIIIFVLVGAAVLLFSFAAPNPNLPGDLNGDNRVDGADLSFLAANYKTNNASADINNSGTVDVADLSILLSNYGRSITAVPSIPTSLTATPGDSSVSLHWNANPTSDNVDTYQVYYQPTCAWNGTTIEIDNITSTSYTVTGLTNGTGYCFRVSAHNSSGFSPWNDPPVAGTPAGGAGGGGSSGGTCGGYPYFAANSVWNTPTGQGSVPATLDPNSASWVSQLRGAVGGININQGDYNPVVFNADASTPRYKVTSPNGWLTDSVPIPSGFTTSPGDGWGIVLDSSTCRIYAITHTPTITSPTTATISGSGIAGLYNWIGPGTWDSNTGPWIGGASGISYISGTITPEDVKAGVINHALAITLPKTLNRSGGNAGVAGCAGDHVYPASTSDGTGGCTTIPMGAHIRLDPSLSPSQLQALDSDPGDLMILQALQKYGAYDRDSTNSGGLVFYAVNNLLSPGGSTFGYPSGWSNGIPTSIVQYLQVLSPASGVFDSVTTYGQPHK